MTVNIATLIVIILNLTTCMTVYDEIEYNTYCPKNNTCEPPESHLVCKFFHSVKKTNLICLNYTLDILTHVDQKRILEKTNKIRAAVANGKQTGKDDLPLPRGYGMFRIFWDSELAGLSEFVLRKAEGGSWFSCAATGKFVKPILSGSFFDVTPDLDIVEKIYESWENHKNLITVSDIEECRDLSQSSYAARYFIRIIQGLATHMGCASAMCDRTGKNKRKINRFACYFSYWTPISAPVYMIDPPIPGAGYTSKCGCPPGYWEDDECLCEKLNSLTTSTAANYYRLKYNSKRK